MQQEERQGGEPRPMAERVPGGDGPELERNTRLAVDYCLAHPRWRLSLQAHKILGID